MMRRDPAGLQHPGPAEEAESWTEGVLLTHQTLSRRWTSPPVRFIDLRRPAADRSAQESHLLQTEPCPPLQGGPTSNQERQNSNWTRAPFGEE